uniref:Uncharacterized protein n=1 Tax=Geospiza parvula TaxID=87175 RepID=A0A8C3MFM2_GEOPR
MQISPPSLADPARSPDVFPLRTCQVCEGQVTFGCLASGFFPQPADIAWVGVAWGGSASREFPEVRTGAGSFGRSSLATLGAAEAQGKEFTCRVGHYGKEIEEKVQAPVATPSVTVLPPSLHDLYLSTQPNLTCVATNLPSPDGVEFTWSRTGGGASPVGGATSGPARKLPNGLYELRNVLGICAEDWNSGDEFTCAVSAGSSHPSLTTPPHNSTPSGVQAVAPKVFVFPPPAEDLARGESAILTCLASGFRPRDVLVTWTQQDAPVPPERFSVLGPAPDAPEGSGRFSVYSKLEVPAEEWRRGDVFGCVVGHEGAGLRFIQRNLDRSMARPASVNVSVILADSDTVCY